jgi:hypothetical protein
MRRHRIGSVIGAVVAALSLAVVPATLASAGTHHGAKHGKAHHVSAAGGAPSLAACSDLKAEQAKESQLETSMEQAMASGNLATIKQALLAEFTQISKSISAVESRVGGAPANVKAAFATLLGAFKTVESGVQSATSLTQLGESFTSLGTNPKITAASQTLASYYGAKCV